MTSDITFVVYTDVRKYRNFGLQVMCPFKFRAICNVSLATNFHFLQIFLKKIIKNSRIFVKNAAFSYILGIKSCQIFQKISQLSNFVKTFRKIFSKNVFF